MERNDLTQSAFTCNGVYFEDVVPGYRTLNSRGRYLLEKSVNFKEPDRADGSVFSFSRFPAREIEIDYFIEAENWEQFQERYLILSQYLNADNARIIFNGEADKYVIGSISAPNDVDENLFSRSGTFTIQCADPFKYSVALESVQPESGVWSIDYDGTYKSYPEVIVTFPKTLDADGNNTSTSDCGFVGLETQRGAVLQFGDPEVEDTGLITNPATNPFNKTFETATAADDMTLNDSQTLGSNYEQMGNVAVNTTNKYVYPHAYGSAANYHGPALSYIIGSQYVATNFALSWKQKLAATKKQFGCCSVLLFNNNAGTRKLIAGINFQKTTKDQKTSVYFYAGSNSKKWTGSKNKKVSAVKTSSITKSDKMVTFSTCGKTVNIQLDDETAALVANEVVLYFGKNGTKTALGTNAIYNVSLTQFEYETEGDVPNLFMPGDTLRIDTATAGVYLDSGDGETPAQTIGALGNDWETFCLEPGANNIAIDFSDFITDEPEVVLNYRKVYL